MKKSLLAAIAVSFLAAGSADALDKCKAKIRGKDGLILVSAKEVDGVLQWGYEAGAETNDVADPACVSGDRARNCQLGAEPPESTTPPQDCVLYLADDSATCAAFIKKCTPGLRRNVAPLGGGIEAPDPLVIAGTSDCLIGEVRMFGGNFTPKNFALAHGQEIPVSGNDALFSIYGTIYGGDGRTTFGLPDMRGLEPAGVNYMVCVAGVFPSRE